MSRKDIMRMLPILFFLLIGFEFLVMLNFSEPYPAVILPPFKETSFKDTLQASSFKFLIYADTKNPIEFDYGKLIDGAPKSTVFSMLLSLPNEKKYSQAKDDKGPKTIRNKLKETVFNNRKKALEKSDASYPRTERWLREGINDIANIEADSIVILKIQFRFIRSEEIFDSSASHIKTIKW